MKKLRLGIVILLVMLMLGGCAKPIELTDEETDMFAEYISKEVLERDKYYDQGLLAQQYEEDEDDTEEKQTAAPGTVSGVANVNYVSAKTPEAKKYVDSTLDQILGNSSISVSYQSVKNYDSYPEDGANYFVISSSKGYKLLVVTFDLKNTSGKDVRYSMLTSDVSYKLTTENGSTYSPLLTLLVDDLQFVNKVIPANKTEKGLLVFRINENEVKSKAALQIESGTKRTALELR